MADWNALEARLWRHHGVIVHETAIIYPNVTIGKGTRIGAYAVIGGPAEKHGHFDKPGLGVAIGENCFLGEHVTIHTGTEQITTIEDNCIILTKAQVGHDARLEPSVTMSCLTVAGGHSRIMRGANIGLGAKIVQWAIVPPFTMIGANAVVPKRMRMAAGATYAGVPAKMLKLNAVGLERAHVTQEELQGEIERYRGIWQAVHGKE